MVCRGCGKQLRNNQNICPSCGFYNDLENDSLEADDRDYFDNPKDATDSNSLILDDKYNDLSFEDDEADDIDRVKEQEEIDDLFQEKVLGKKPKKRKNDKGSNEPDGLGKASKNKAVEYIDADDSADFIAAFIGEDYKWIVNKPLNIYALLFSWMYFVYRKLYIIGILGLVLVGVIVRYVPVIAPVIIILSMVLSAVIFNPIYLAVVKIRVQRLIDKYGDETDNFILDKCIQQGGVNTPRALLVFLIFLVALFFTYYSINFGGKKTKFFEENSENEANCLYISKETFNFLVNKQEKEMIDASLDEAGCHVNISDNNSYDIYLKIKYSDGFRYVYFVDDDKNLTIEADTNYIEKLKEAKEAGPLDKEDEVILEKSQNLNLTFNELKLKAKSEEDAAKKNKLTSQRTNFIFGKDDIFKKSKK